MNLLNLLRKYYSSITTVDYRKLANRLSEFWGNPPENRCCYHYSLTNSYCGRKLLRGSDMCFWHSKTQEKYKADIIREYFGFADNLKDVIEKEISNKGSLEGAYLSGASIEKNFFGGGVNLSNANLYKADLSRSHLSYGSLSSANLGDANLESSYLSYVDLNNADFTGTRLFNVKFSNNDFTTVKGLSKNNFFGWNNFLPVYRILEKYPEQSQPIYRKLIKYFSNEGNIDDASWAAFRERIQYRKLLYKDFKGGLSIILIKYLHRNYNLLQFIILWILIKIKSFFQLIFSYSCSLVFGYGEKPFRVIITSVITIVIYAFIYSYFDIIKESDFHTSLYFSIVTFTTLGYGDLLPKKQFRLLTGTEALTGIVLTGLFLFTLSRRTVSRN
jgi:hypothetical protein